MLTPNGKWNQERKGREREREKQKYSTSQDCDNEVACERGAHADADRVENGERRVAQPFERIGRRRERRMQIERVAHYLCRTPRAQEREAAETAVWRLPHLCKRLMHRLHVCILHYTRALRKHFRKQSQAFGDA